MRATRFQIRRRHRNEEVRELIPADYAGGMVTDRGKSYDAEELLGVKQQKCLDHLKENINEVLEHKTGRARSFGLKLKSILREARQLWRDQRAGKAKKFQAEVERMEEELTTHLRPRFLKDEDNQRLLDGIGLQHDRGRLRSCTIRRSNQPTTVGSGRCDQLRDAIPAIHDGRILELDSIDGHASNTQLFGPVVELKLIVKETGNSQTRSWS